MSLTPPKFIQMLRKRDQDDLLARLRALADKWDTEGRQAEETQDYEEEIRATGWLGAAAELREVLDAHD